MKEERGSSGVGVYINSSDEGQFHGQVDALVSPTFDVRRQHCTCAHGDGDTSVMELEASGKGSDNRLVLEQRELHANADSWTFREGEEAAPTVAHLVCGGDTVLPRCAVFGFCV